MSVIDLESLLAEISPDSPSGDDLEYDPLFQEMERAGQGKPEQQMGDSVIPAEDPDWKELKRKAIEVLGKTRDLRAAVYLTRALVRINGYEGLADGLALLSGLVQRYWDTVHPQLDPEDDNDPTLRVNTLETIADLDANLRGLREAPLVAHPVMGRYGLREIEIASGETPAPPGWEGDLPDTAAINAAFMDVELDALTGTADVVNACLEQIAALEAAMLEHLDPASTPDLSPMTVMLQRAKKTLAEPLSQRGVAAEEEAGEGAGDTAAVAQQRIAGEITSREDVARVLDKLCDFYRRSEPSSPVPILLQRAKRLAAMDFMEIVKDLAPGGIAEVEQIRGPLDEH